MEKWGVILGAVLFLAGLLMVVWPQPGAMRFSTNGALGMSQGVHVQGVTKTGARFYGVVTALLGAGIVSLSRYRGKS